MVDKRREKEINPHNDKNINKNIGYEEMFRKNYRRVYDG